MCVCACVGLCGIYKYEFELLLLFIFLNNRPNEHLTEKPNYTAVF